MGNELGCDCGSRGRCNGRDTLRDALGDERGWTSFVVYGRDSGGLERGRVRMEGLLKRLRYAAPTLCELPERSDAMGTTKLAARNGRTSFSTNNLAEGV